MFPNRPLADELDVDVRDAILMRNSTRWPLICPDGADLFWRQLSLPIQVRAFDVSSLRDAIGLVCLRIPEEKVIWVHAPRIVAGVTDMHIARSVAMAQAVG